MTQPRPGPHARQMHQEAEQKEKHQRAVEVHTAKQLRKANKELSEKESRVRACLNYLGIEDKRLLDNYKPLTQIVKQPVTKTD